MGGRGLLLGQIFSRALSIDTEGSIQIVASRDKFDFLYERDTSRSGSIETLCVGREGRGAFDSLNAQKLQPLAAKVVVE